MISAITPFNEIVLGVKDETGITNLSNQYDKIRRLIFRAEKIIGPGGTVVLKKRTYSNISGGYVPYPEDFIWFESIGSCCSGSLCPCDHFERPNGIKLKSTIKNVVLFYWGLQVDGYGYPMTTENRLEAVVAFIVWKMYSPRVFLGEGNMNAKKDYEYIFNQEVGAARGNDAFPTSEEYDAIGQMTMLDRRLLVALPSSMNPCLCSEDLISDDCEPEPGPEPESLKIHYWQFDDFTSNLSTATNDYLANPDTYLNDKPSGTEQEFSVYQLINYQFIGRICFAIKNSQGANWSIYDILGSNITNSVFDSYYDIDTDCFILVSKNIYSSYSINFKITRNG